jgi:hypothetical protein
LFCFKTRKNAEILKWPVFLGFGSGENFQSHKFSPDPRRRNHARRFRPKNAIKTGKTLGK